MTRFNPQTDNHFLWKFWGCALNRSATQKWVMGVGGIVMAITFIVLISLSVRNISETEMAIPYGKTSRRVGEVQLAGRRAYSPDIELFKYDRKFVSNDLNLSCVSKDGLVLNLDITQQYRLFMEELHDIFYNFGKQKHLETLIQTLGKSVIMDSCSSFTGEEFFSRRGDIEQDMIANMSARILNTNSHAEPGFIQLRNIQLPRRFLTAIQEKQLALQEVNVVLNEREQILIQAETRRQQARLNADIRLVDAQAQADAITMTAQERANARLTQWAERTKAFIIDLEALGVDPESYVDEYLFVRLQASTLTPLQQSCIRNCPPNTACWYCFTNASPSVSV